jgi:uncharacterized protein YidB (DUF937 family)
MNCRTRTGYEGGAILATEVSKELMGLLDIAESMIASQFGSGNSGGLPGGLGSSNVLGAVLNTVNSQPGGLAGVLESLTQGGLGGAVNSWISTGQNMPVNPQQVQGALGSGVVTDLASKLGVSPDLAGTVLSQLLPHVVDHLTPTGQVPASGMSGAGIDLVKSILSGLGR